MQDPTLGPFGTLTSDVYGNPRPLEGTVGANDAVHCSATSCLPCLRSQSLEVSRQALGGQASKHVWDQMIDAWTNDYFIYSLVLLQMDPNQSSGTTSGPTSAPPWLSPPAQRSSSSALPQSGASSNKSGQQRISPLGSGSGGSGPIEAPAFTERELAGGLSDWHIRAEGERACNWCFECGKWW